MLRYMVIYKQAMSNAASASVANSAKASDCRCMHEAMGSSSQRHWTNFEVSKPVI